MSLLEIKVPDMEWLLEAPLITLLVGATLGVLFEAVIPRGYRYHTRSGLAALVTVTALGLTLYNWAGGQFKIIAPGSIALDGPSRCRSTCFAGWRGGGAG